MTEHAADYPAVEAAARPAPSTPVSPTDLARGLMVWTAGGDPLSDSPAITRMLAGITRRDISIEAVRAAMRAAQHVAWLEEDIGHGDADDQAKTMRMITEAQTRLTAACTDVMKARLL